MTLFQRPNLPLIMTTISLILLIATSGTLRIIFSIIFIFASTIWSYEEAKNGINTFRKALGYAGFIALSIFLFFELSTITL